MQVHFCKVIGQHYLLNTSMHFRKLWHVSLLLLPAFMILPSKILAHPMPNTVVELSVSDHSVFGVAKMPFIVWMDATKSTEEKVDSTQIVGYFQQHIKALSGNDVWKTNISGFKTIEEFDREVGKYTELEIYFELTPSTPSALHQFDFAYDAIIHEVLTHKILIYLKYDWNSGMITDEATRPVGVIATDFKLGKCLPLKIDIDGGSWIKGTWAMFLFGMEHIRVGLDHILFLLTLLIVSPLAVFDKRWTGFEGYRHTLFRFLKISIAFTIGHSITLLVGSFDLIPFRAQYIEVLIALSILISAIHCIKPVFVKKEAWVAAGFGLIHGLAFSISLSSMNLGWQARLLSVVGFNLGIESMQLIIMVCFFPLLITSKWKFYPAFRVAFAIITGITAVAWIFERVLEKENFITEIANSIL
ncbi:HupE/UreJ family protein [Limibacter armeniacum]|uniref:HupE/UreJ family protein n=1 Tax=Limibacter armeniacum TaxID=466084 RepID=UPI002FE5B382